MNHKLPTMSDVTYLTQITRMTSREAAIALHDKIVNIEYIDFRIDKTSDNAEWRKMRRILYKELTSLFHALSEQGFLNRDKHLISADDIKYLEREELIPSPNLYEYKSIFLTAQEATNLLHDGIVVINMLDEEISKINKTDNPKWYKSVKEELDKYYQYKFIELYCALEDQGYFTRDKHLLLQYDVDFLIKDGLQKERF